LNQKVQPLSSLLIFDFPFISMILRSIGSCRQRRHCGDEFRHWGDGEQRRNTDVQIDVPIDDPAISWRRQTCQCRSGFDKSCGFERKLEQDRISICLTQISWTVSKNL